MTQAPVFDVDMEAFWHDPYPVLKQMRTEAPICYVPQLDAVLMTRRDDIAVSEKNIEVFSSHQPAGLMNTLMGHNMMRKDGDAHAAERKAIFPTVSPKTVRDHWNVSFETDATLILDGLVGKGRADICKEYALPLSGDALRAITGLTNFTSTEMDACSQAMIDGISNYSGDQEVEARCHAATAKIDTAIDYILDSAKENPNPNPNPSLANVMLAAGLPDESIRANIKLAISGGQNEPRDAIAGCIWALLTNPEQLKMVLAGEVKWQQVFEEFARWISPIGMSPRRIAKEHSVGGIELEPETRLFFMYGSANRDEDYFPDGDKFDITRNNAKSIAFGAGPHFCAGAWASRSLIGDVALPMVFDRLKGLRLADDQTKFGGWAFRGPLSLNLEWDS
ncbi:MAG: cytochrome P450 [Rhizobiaceae bacterium]